MKVFAAVYDRDLHNDYGDTMTIYDPDDIYATHEGAQKYCNGMNERGIEIANRQLQRRHDEAVRKWKRSKVLHEAGLQNWLPPEPEQPTPYSLENLPRESHYVEEIEVHP